MSSVALQGVRLLTTDLRSKPHTQKLSYVGGGIFEDSSPGADLRCAPARAGPPSKGAGHLGGWDS